MAEAVRRHEGPSQKSLISDENFKPQHTHFVPISRFVAIYALFGNLWTKKVFLWVKKSVSWARSALLHGLSSYYTELNFQICNYAQKRRICRENSKYVLDEICCGQTATLGSVKTCSIAHFFLYNGFLREVKVSLSEVRAKMLVQKSNLRSGRRKAFCCFL